MIGGIMTQGSTNYHFERKQLLTYCLLGDPELDIYTNRPKLALNPFTKNIYEGQLVTTTIRDVSGKVIPYARIHLKTSNGKYYTTYADINGLASFRLPAQENEVYNVTITGHNLIPSYFNFTALPDNTKPQISGTQIIPKNPSTSDSIIFNIETYDNQSGIESTYLLLSKSNFSTYTYYGLSNEFEENGSSFTLNIDRLEPDEYSYLIVARDYANNTNVFYKSNFTISIPMPIIDYVFIVSIIMIIGVVGISVFFLYKSFHKYSGILKDIAEFKLRNE
jgi:hypothetical protein